MVKMPRPAPWQLVQTAVCADPKVGSGAIEVAVLALDGESSDGLNRRSLADNWKLRREWQRSEPHRSNQTFLA
jgi:hypothetical protein